MKFNAGAVKRGLQLVINKYGKNLITSLTLATKNNL